MLSFAMNHMAMPSLRYDAFLDICAGLGMVGVEFRNDLAAPLFHGDEPAQVAAAVRARGLRILALAEVKQFNNFSDAKRAEAAALIKVAVACGAEAVSLIPRNDGKGLGNGERVANLRVALRELRPLLDEAGLIGLVEPLGFEVCSLRSKAETVEVIEALGAAGTYKLVHDTFHHHLAGGGPIFPDHTGIVHISGVSDPDVGTAQMTDAHRVLVDAHDRLGNLAQIEALQSAGYRGPLSFEPFSPLVHGLADPAPAFAAAIAFITQGVREQAA